MGNAQSYTAASLSACCVYIIYVYIYCSHKLLKTSVLNNERLPSFVYLYIKYVTRALTRRTGYLHTATTKTRDVVYTVLSCRLETPLLRRFCSAAGYGWDYPDTQYRDIPLCFPEILCCRLLLMVLTDENFSLSPAVRKCVWTYLEQVFGFSVLGYCRSMAVQHGGLHGRGPAPYISLVRVQQRLKTLQPVDELKRGPFMLQARVLEYRQIDAGVEVDICLSATSRAGCPVWESVLTLLSKNTCHKASRCLLKNECECLSTGQPNESVPENVKWVELRVPRITGLQCVWSFSDYNPYRLLSLPARLVGYRLQAPSLWMLSVCLAEIEKHKGVGVITAPISITAQFKEPLLVPGRVTIKFWETTKDGDQSPAQSVSFHMQQHGSNISHMKGLISR